MTQKIIFPGETIEMTDEQWKKFLTYRNQCRAKTWRKLILYNLLGFENEEQK